MTVALLLGSAPAHAAPRGGIDVVQVNGLIDPANAALIKSSLRNAARDHAKVIVFQLDASGAIDVDFDKLFRDFRASTVRTAVWVGPSGGAARGAAAWLALSADAAAIAPGAHFGPIVPVRYDHPSQRVPAVTANPTVSDKQATLQQFIASLDGKTLRGQKISTLTGPVGKRTLSDEVHFHKLDLTQQLAHTLDRPWVAYFLFLLGLALIILEFFTASVGIAGFVGACALVGACFGFSHLPVEWWALALLGFGMFGLSIDVQVGGLGPWTFIGTAALIAGSLFLYGGSARLDPSWWVLLLVIGSTLLFMLSGMTAMVRSRFSTPTIGREDLVGEMGEATVDITPDGVVRVRDALWRARTNRATPIHTGDRVRVVAVEGITLEVEPESGGARDYRERRRS
ncbi:MAG TPA: NfeD family protein [Acidimicrobiia bacterium]|nr:NfeD family protein [Acidimicrobiia bacterium]